MQPDKAVQCYTTIVDRQVMNSYRNESVLDLL